MLLAGNFARAEPERPPTTRKWAVIDLDGVVADTRHRLHCVERQPKNWEAFFAAATQDPLLPEGAAVVDQLAHDHTIVYVTGRPERWRSDTERWLTTVGLPDRRRCTCAATRTTDRPGWSSSASFASSSPRRRSQSSWTTTPRSCMPARSAGFTVLQADWMSDQPALFEAQEVDGAT